MEATGKLKPGTSELMITTLMEEVANFEPRDAFLAVQKHKENSVFWPFLADLMKYIRPEIDGRERHYLWLESERSTMRFMLEGANEKDTKRITEAFKARGVEFAENLVSQLNGPDFQPPKLKQV